MSLHIFDRGIGVTCYPHVVAGEAAAWVASGVIVGLFPGLVVSLVLLHGVNSRRFQRSPEG